MRSLSLSLSFFAGLPVVVVLLLVPSFAPADAPMRGETQATAEAPPSAPATGGDARPHYDDRMTPAGQAANGFYFTGPYMRIYGAEGIIRSVKRAGANAAVIDIKDDQGRVFFDTSIDLLAGSEHAPRTDIRETVRRIKEAGIYTIGRIVCFNDPILPSAHLDRAVLDTRPRREGRAWVSWGNGNTWLDPSNPANHELLRQLAVETAALGFDEIQLDYIRFPVDEGTRFARFPHLDESRLRRCILLDFLRKVDAAIAIPLSVDVFGLTTLREGDPTGLGQSLGDWTEHVDAYTPMLYINNFHSWRPRDARNRAGSLVQTGVYQLRRRLGDRPVIRPFLQAFRTGADYYDGGFIAEQVRAARDGGADGFLFWHPASNYGLVQRALRGSRLVPFPIDARLAARAHRGSAPGE